VPRLAALPENTYQEEVVNTASAIHALKFVAGSIGAAGLIVAAPLSSAQQKGSVGISMPNKAESRWNAEGAKMAKEFQGAGYQADLQYAEDDIPNQVSQIESMINKGAKVLVIVAIDGTKLAGALQKAADKGIKIIAYDRLIKGSPNVDYHTTFDNFQVGVLQANSIVDKLGLKQGKGPFNIELFAGSPDDNNAHFFFNGAMSVLKPHIDGGKLVVRSKQSAMDKVATLRWDANVAQARMDKLLSAFYGKDRLHAVLSPNDGLAVGILASAMGAGYCSAQQPCPIVTGQDADIPAVKSIIRGEQASTVFKDTRELAKVTVKLVDDVLAGKKPEVNDTKTYNNGVKVIPTRLLKPVLVDQSNWKQVLVNSGYYTETQLKVK
jgi:putative multiple sugar transport system substrate-binding protein